MSWNSQLKYIQCCFRSLMLVSNVQEDDLQPETKALMSLATSRPFSLSVSLYGGSNVLKLKGNLI